MRPQNSSGSALASARSFSSCSIDLMWACSEKAGGGGKSRSSRCSDSMFVVVDDDMANEIVLRKKCCYLWQPCVPQNGLTHQPVACTITRQIPDRQFTSKFMKKSVKDADAG